MQEIYKPNYKGGSIVNLMSSIAKTFKGQIPYEELELLPSKNIKKYKNIILLVIDGLGYNFLVKQKNSFLKNNLIGKMDSVFLSTTACANATFDFGVPPQQTALTGWFMNLKEAGMITKILPFNPRLGGEPLSKYGIKIKKIIDEKGFMSKIKGKKYKLMPKQIINSDFSSYVSNSAKKVGFKNLKDMLNKIKTITKEKGKKYIHAYYPDFDGDCHEKGINSKKAITTFKNLDKQIKKFSKSIKNTNTLFIVTADHGLIDTPKKKVLYLEEHKELEDCLSMPLSGEGRVAYCYVRLSKVKQFEDYIKNNLSNKCFLFKSEDIINENYFGLGKPNEKLGRRLGDYILIMKENYIIKDHIEEKNSKSIGHHAGITPEEMLVPLIIIKSENH